MIHNFCFGLVTEIHRKTRFLFPFTSKYNVTPTNRARIVPLCLGESPHAPKFQSFP